MEQKQSVKELLRKFEDLNKTENNIAKNKIRTNDVKNNINFRSSDATLIENGDELIDNRENKEKHHTEFCYTENSENINCEANKIFDNSENKEEHHTEFCYAENSENIIDEANNENNNISNEPEVHQKEDKKFCNAEELDNSKNGKQKVNNEYNSNRPEANQNENRKSYNILKEICDTERSYIEILKKLVETYVKIVNDYYFIEKYEIFEKIQSLYVEQKKFYEKLLEANYNTKIIIHIFKDSESLFQLYPKYMKTQSLEKHKLEELSNIIQENHKNLRDSLGLYSHVMNPIQRLPRYILLLEDLLKEVKEENRTTLTNVIIMVKKYTDEGNTSIARSEIKKQPKGLNFGNFLVRKEFEVKYQNETKNLMVYLFRNIIVFTENLQGNKDQYFYIDRINLDKCYHTRIKKKEPDCIILEEDNISFELHTKEQVIFEQWHDEIYKLLLEHGTVEKERLSAEIKRKPSELPKKNQPNSEPTKSKLENILEEILLSEKNVVDVLKKIDEEYKPIVKNIEDYAIFKVFDNLYAEQKQFCRRLRQEALTLENVLKLFEDSETLLQIYPEYLKIQALEKNLLQTLTRQIQENAVIDDALGLYSNLMNPCQRIGKYELFFKELLNEVTCQSLQTRIKNIISLIQKYMTQGNTLVAIAEIKKLPRHYRDDVGTYIMKEEFEVKSGYIAEKRTHMIYLFENCIILTVELSPDTYMYLHTIRLSELYLNKDDFNTIILSNEKSHGLNHHVYYLFSKSEEVFITWYNKLQEMLWIQLEKIKAGKAEDVTHAKSKTPLDNVNERRKIIGHILKMQDNHFQTSINILQEIYLQLDNLHDLKYITFQLQLQEQKLEDELKNKKIFDDVISLVQTYISQNELYEFYVKHEKFNCLKIANNNLSIADELNENLRLSIRNHLKNLIKSFGDLKNLQNLQDCNEVLENLIKKLTDCLEKLRIFNEASKINALHLFKSSGEPLVQNSFQVEKKGNYTKECVVFLFENVILFTEKETNKQNNTIYKFFDCVFLKDLRYQTDGHDKIIIYSKKKNLVMFKIEQSQRLHEDIKKFASQLKELFWKDVEKKIKNYVRK